MAEEAYGQLRKEETRKAKAKRKHTHLNAEFPRIARRDKKALLSDQCREVEENNRMRKTRDLFKKIRDTKGTFHAKMGSIKDRNGMDQRTVKMAEEQDGKTTFSLTNSSKEHFNAEQTPKKQLLQAGRGHQATRKADHCLQKQVGKNIKDKKGDKGGGEGASSRGGKPVLGREF